MVQKTKNIMNIFIILILTLNCQFFNFQINNDKDKNGILQTLVKDSNFPKDRFMFIDNEFWIFVDSNHIPNPLNVFIENKRVVSKSRKDYFQRARMDYIEVKEIIISGDKSSLTILYYPEETEMQVKFIKVNDVWKIK